MKKEKGDAQACESGEKKGMKEAAMAKCVSVGEAESESEDVGIGEDGAQNGHGPEPFGRGLCRECGGGREADHGMCEDRRHEVRSLPGNELPAVDAWCVLFSGVDLFDG